MMKNCRFFSFFKEISNFFAVFALFSIIFCINSNAADYDTAEENNQSKEEKTIIPEYNDVDQGFIFRLEEFSGLIPEKDLNAIADSFVIDFGRLYCGDVSILQKYSHNVRIRNIIKIINRASKGQDCTSDGKYPKKMRENLAPFTMAERRNFIKSITFNAAGNAASWEEPSKIRSSYNLTDRIYRTVRRTSESPVFTNSVFCHEGKEKASYDVPAEDLTSRCRNRFKTGNGQ